MLDTDNRDMDKRSGITSDFVTLLGSYIIRIKQLPKATGTMFAARTPTGRSIKIFLFGLGVAFPLGILILALLFWHGIRINRKENQCPAVFEKAFITATPDAMSPIPSNAGASSF